MPGKAFCDEGTLWQCTKTGRDAVNAVPCTGGSASNPVGCFTSNCGSAAACCRWTRAPIYYDFLAPFVAKGDFHVYDGHVNASPVGQTCSLDPVFNASLTIYPAAGVCPARQAATVNVGIVRASASPGQTITLPSPAVSLSAFDAAGVSCFAFSGTVTWHSDVPNWRVTIDATCSTVGKDLRVRGELGGRL
ncbi:hypothetical protein OWM54_43015 [Myxococcus sp. MISCRS1]|uniref:hypothetical protein n=1 Tax=Myxococcus sp. MISCRS1 TaxID=2996786 RepID=UPI00226DDC95|nr:hypothetical protein [Myxococcus sp. MISCRS1]MCY1003937.1 hypothetical protein [Myxococcus sp. MISCRS1]